MPNLNMLHQDPEMITRMELDLITKAQAAFADAEIAASIHGVFSLDELEDKLESDLCGGIALGVGYFGAVRLSPATNQNPSQGNSSANVEFRYGIILAVPTEQACTERYRATTLLSLLRLRIEGTTVAGTDRVSRAWAFVSEEPKISDSSKSMLYYAQVWRVALNQSGNNKPS